MKTTTETPKRKDAEKSWAELVVACVLENPEARTKDEILSSDLAWSNLGHTQNLLTRDENEVTAYAEKFATNASHLFKYVTEVHLIGKSTKSGPADFVEAQKNLNNRQKSTDVLSRLVDNSFVAYSVKDSRKAALTNYPIEADLPYSEELKNLRLSVIQEAGLPLTLDKDRRDEYNKLFYGDGNNTYHRHLRQVVLSNTEEILDKWVNNLWPTTEFDFYVFNGDCLKLANSQGKPKGKFTLHQISNPHKRSNGKAAKIYFLVKLDGTPFCHWDVRWKGSVLVSPQIQTYMI